ncbi:MAG: TonB-dependent receptor [Muribaculaceae bacterium]
MLPGMSLSATVTDDDALPDDTVHLRNVTVTTQSYRDLIPAQTLSGRELEALRSHSVADGLRYFSGLQIKDYGGVGGIKTVNIRSMGTNHMGVYYNGIELGNAQNGQVDLGKYSLQNIESVDMYNGQRSDIFQSAREFGSAGSIYLNSRIPHFAKGKKSNLEAGIRAGSFDLINPFVMFEYSLTPSTSLSFNSEWVSSSGKYKFRYRRVAPSGELAYDTTAVRQNGDIDAVRFEMGLNGNIPGGRWRVNLYHYNSERGVPGAIVNNVWRRGERLWDRNTFMQASLRKNVTRLWSFRVAAKYAYDYTHYVNNDEKLVRVDNTYRQKEVFFSFSNRFDILPGWQASAAADVQWNGLSDYVDVHRVTAWFSAAMSYNAGNWFKAQASVLGTLVDEEKRDRDSAPDKFRMTPAVFVSAKPFSKANVVLRAFAKQSYRMPTFNDLYYTDAGNAYLKPEMASQYNVGLTYDVVPTAPWFAYFKVSTDVYYNYVKDKIVAYPKGQQFRWTMLNLGKVDIRGIDASIMATFSLPERINLTVKGQYTYQKAIDVTNPADNYYRHQIPYIPWHSASAIAMLDWHGWGLNYSFIYTGERYNQQENIRYNYTQPWYTSDVSLLKSFTVRKKWQFSVCAEINNLFSQDYDVILNYPMPKRNYKLTVNVKI